MDTKIIKIPNENLDDYLNNFISQNTKINIAVSFFCNSGLNLIIESLNKFKNKPLGIGKNQTKIKAGIVKRKPISKYGGKYCIAGLAITKPKPKIIGTSNAINISLIFIFPAF